MCECVFVKERERERERGVAAMNDLCKCVHDVFMGLARELKQKRYVDGADQRIHMGEARCHTG